MNAVLVVAGGSGTRMGLNIPKQFYEVDGKPIIVYGLSTFEATGCVDSVFIVCSEHWMDYLQSLIQKYKLNKVKRIISGGTTRQESVYNGVVALSEDLTDDDYIGIVDANRPLIKPKDIQMAFDAAQKFGAAVVCDDCVDTMYFSEDKACISGVIDRSKLFKGQVPEVAKLSMALEVMQKAREDQLNDQTLTALLLHYGKQVTMIPGTRKNFKITTAEDLDLFKAYLLLERFITNSDRED